MLSQGDSSSLLPGRHGWGTGHFVPPPLRASRRARPGQQLATAHTHRQPRRSRPPNPPIPVPLACRA
jgi:hypothetical protein